VVFYDNALYHTAKRNGVVVQRPPSADQEPGHRRTADGNKYAYDIPHETSEEVSVCRRKLATGYMGFGGPGGCHFFAEMLARSPPNPENVELIATSMGEAKLAERVRQRSRLHEKRTHIIGDVLAAVGRRDAAALDRSLR
jgi:hypothetical protein